MDNSRNTFLAIALSIVVILAWQFFYITPKMEDERRAAEIQRQQAEQTRQASPAPQSDTDSDIPVVKNPENSGSADVPGAIGDIPGSQALNREAALSRDPRIAIESSRLTGSLNLKGARVDDLRLKGYRETIDKDSPLITLFSPSSLTDGYFAEFGYVGADSSGAVPGSDTIWTLQSGSKLTPTTPVTLTWTNDRNVTFTRTISVDDNYLFTYIDGVVNNSDAPLTMSPYGRVTRFSKPVSQATFVLHEGMIGYFGEEGLQEISYSDMEDEPSFTTDRVDDGWLGITDKYWAAALAPQGEFKPRFSYFQDGRPRFQSDFLSDAITIPVGQSAESKQLLFAGAKEVDVIDEYESEQNITSFELLIDWGWFYFLTKPTFYLLDWLFKFFGNFGVAILAGTVLIKAALFPLANMSYKSMANMKKLQPEMTAMRERYGDDKVKLQQEMMALYKKEKINPAAGCWPMLVQIPIFFALYKVLYITIEMRHAPFFGWVQDLAAPDPTTIFNLFGLLPFEVPAFLMIGVWPLIMGITMFLQMQMNPTPPDPTQAMIFKWMPVVFTFMLATFPAGLVIYWAWNNTLSVLQQAFIMKRHGVDIALFDNLGPLGKSKDKQDKNDKK
ncbi:MAG: membrane protein insertase YidC [Rhizobiaceae bacterium]